MKADLTRNTFDPLKHYTRVLMQQGRVQLDADWNEQVAISLRHLRALAADLIGPAGGPVHNVGFQILDAGLYPDFRIGAGHYYVDGILCEADTASVPIVPQPDAAPAATVFKLYLPTLMLDDVAFYKPKSGLAPQYVEIYDADAPTTSVIRQVKDFDLSKQVLTVDKDIKSVWKTKPRLRRVVTYLTQPDYPVPAAEQFPKDGTASRSYLFYLDVWERHVTYIEDDSIREVALGRADTATRVKLVWQVKVAPGSVAAAAYGSPCDGFKPDNDHFFATLDSANRGQLKAMAKQDVQATDPCITPPQARYRGVENQLYRVEIHSGGKAWNGIGDPPTQGVATFKWSRENGSVVYPIRQLATDVTAHRTAVTLETLGRDERFGLVEGDWVEIVDDDYELQNLAQPLLQVQTIDRGSMSVTLEGTAAVNVGQRQSLLRRWDHKAGDPEDGDLQLASDGAALVLEQTGDAWLNLEDGVRIQFQPKNPFDESDRYQYKTGDYWLIPARTATGDVEWSSVKDPQSGLTLPVGLPPQGIQHHYAPLAVVTAGSSGSITVANCRKQFATQAQNLVYDYVGSSSGIGARQLKKKKGGGAHP